MFSSAFRFAADQKLLELIVRKKISRIYFLMYDIAGNELNLVQFKSVFAGLRVYEKIF